MNNNVIQYKHGSIRRSNMKIKRSNAETTKNNERLPPNQPAHTPERKDEEDFSRVGVSQPKIVNFHGKCLGFQRKPSGKIFN